MNLRLVSFPLAGSGGRAVHINPEQVVCVMEAGAGRAQIITTGLSGENSISLIVEGAPNHVVQQLHRPAAARGADALAS
jgi:hypothetical protein